MQQLPSPASVFCLAAPSDTALLAKWERHLTPLVQARYITLWSNRHLMAGTPRTQQMQDHLDHADLIVLMVSDAFFANDECSALMMRAIQRAERNEVRLIPLLLRPVAWRESLLVPYPCIPSSNESPVTRWSNRDAAFDACVRDIRRLLGRPITAPLPRHHTHTEALQNLNRIRMLRRVHAIWIDGLLTQSLHQAARIELSLQDRPDMLANPWRLQVQELDQVPHAFPDGTTVIQVYDRANGELIILGEPGSGKTTLLLELTAILLERAEMDEQLPIPIVFHLSSWAEKRQPLRTWLVEELWTKYQVPRKIGQAWIDANQVLPLLDGLDEVAKEARNACVEQINSYYQSRLEHGNSPIVVCCRSKQYTSLSTRIMLPHAVSILPLTDSQINTYLEQAGEQVKVLRQALNEDAELHSLARQPLMLDIFTFAYQGARASEVPTGETREEIRQTIFARYVGRMLKRRNAPTRYRPEQTIHWLVYLARQMKRQSQTIFYIEHMQPNWLPEGGLGWAYDRLAIYLPGMMMGILASLMINGLLSGLFNITDILIYGLVGALIGELLSRRNLYEQSERVNAKRWYSRILFVQNGVLWAMGIGLSFGLNSWLCNGMTYGVCLGVSSFLLSVIYRNMKPLSPQAEKPVPSKRNILQRLIYTEHGKNTLLIGLVFGLVFGLGVWLRSYEWAVGLGNGLSFGLSYGLVGVLLSVLLVGKGKNIQPTEIITWSLGSLWHSLLDWKHLRNALLLGILILLSVGSRYGYGLIYGLVSEQTLNVELMSYGLSSGLSVGLSYWILLGLFNGISSNTLSTDRRLQPNQGIHHSARHSIVVGLTSGIISFCICILSYGLNYGLSYGLRAGMGIGLEVGWNYGLNYGLGTGLHVGMHIGWVFAITTGLLAGLQDGGLACTRHYVLRWLLWRNNLVPLKYSRFLDFADERILLHKIGGGYIFVHRSLLEYLAEFGERAVPDNSYMK